MKMVLLYIGKNPFRMKYFWKEWCFRNNNSINTTNNNVLERIFSGNKIRGHFTEALAVGIEMRGKVWAVFRWQNVQGFMNFECSFRVKTKINYGSILMLSEDRGRKIYFGFGNGDVDIYGGWIGVESSKCLITGFLILRTVI